MKISEYLPTGAEAKKELSNTGVMVLGAVAAKVINTSLGIKGLLPAGAHLLGGMAVSVFAPDKGYLRLLKPLGWGMQIYGALAALTEGGKDTIDPGFGIPTFTNPIPANIRKFVKEYTPSMNGFDLKGGNDFVNARLAALMPERKTQNPTTMMGLKGVNNLFAA